MVLASVSDLPTELKFETLKWDNDPHAVRLLACACEQVKPVVARRKWRVGIVREFYPDNDSLLGLNVNAGQEIRIRLRRPRDKQSFYPPHDVLGTLIHELTHNAVGPHNASFYKLMDEIYSEVEALIDKGAVPSFDGYRYAGEGERLGGGRALPDRRAVRNAAAAAAEKRLRNTTLLGNGPRVLGGGEDRLHKVLSPSEMAAMAAERRLRDSLWCGVHDESEGGPSTGTAIAPALPLAPPLQTASTNGPRAASLAREGARLGPTDARAPAVASGVLSSEPRDAGRKRQASNDVVVLDGALAETKRRRDVTSNSDVTWDCGLCTFVNTVNGIDARQCAVCGTARELSRVGARLWSCVRCTAANDVGLLRCAVCDAARG